MLFSLGLLVIFCSSSQFLRIAACNIIGSITNQMDFKHSKKNVSIFPELDFEKDINFKVQVATYPVFSLSEDDIPYLLKTPVMGRSTLCVKSSAYERNLSLF